MMETTMAKTVKKTGDHIIDYLVRNNFPLTVKNWVSLNYWDRTVAELQGEELAQLEQLVENGWLVDTDSDLVH